MNVLHATLFHVPMAFLSFILTLNDLNLYEIEKVTAYSAATLTSLSFLIAGIYFIVDTYLMIKDYVPRHNIYFFHHFLALIALPVSYFLKWNYARYVIYYMTFEISTPVYNFTYALHKRGYTDNVIFWCNQWLFAVLFTVIRVLFGTYVSVSLIKEILNDSTVSNYYVILPISLQSLMYYWYYFIINKMGTQKRR